LIGNTGPLLTV